MSNERIEKKRENENQWINKKLTELEQSSAFLQSTQNANPPSGTEGQVSATLSKQNSGAFSFSSDESKKYAMQHFTQQSSQKRDKILSSQNREPFGTDGVLHIRFFNFEEGKPSHHTPKKEDFLLRAKTLYETALSLIDASSLTSSQKAVKKTLLTERYGRLLSSLDIFVPRLTKSNAKLVASLIDQASCALKDFLLDLRVKEGPLDFIEELDVARYFNVFQTAEAELNKKRGVPADLHIFKFSHEAEGSDEEKVYSRFSSRQPVGIETIPSTLRTLYQLSNFQRTACGSYDEKEKTVYTDIVLYRHSSPLPMAIYKKDDQESKMKRQFGAVSCIEQLIEEYANAQLAGNDLSKLSKDNPPVISISSMALLSSIKNDELFMKKESETSQLTDAYLAVSAFDGKTMSVDINGQEVWVRVDFDMMNVGANEPGKIAQKLKVLDPISDEVNTKGFMRFLEKADTYVLSVLSDGKFTQYVTTSSNLNQNNKAIPLFSLLNHYIQASHVSIEIVEAQKELSLIEVQLQAQYEVLKDILSEHDAALSRGDQVTLNQSQKNYAEIMSTIEELRKKSHKQYNQIEKERQKIRETQKKQIQEMKDLVNTILNSDWYQIERVLNRQLDDVLSFVQLRLLMEEKYFSEDKSGLVSTTETFHFQTLYLLANNLLGRIVEFYCKSGEDRTGRLNDTVEEYFCFKDIYGRFPDISDKHDRTAIEAITPIINEYSVSNEICSGNAPGARAKQQGEKLTTNAEAQSNTWKKLAHLAKAGLYKLSEFEKVQEAFKNRKPSKSTEKKEAKLSEEEVIQYIIKLKNAYEHPAVIRFFESVLLNLSRAEREKIIDKKVIQAINQIENAADFIDYLKTTLEFNFIPSEADEEIKQLFKLAKESQETYFNLLYSKLDNLILKNKIRDNQEDLFFKLSDDWSLSDESIALIEEISEADKKNQLTAELLKKMQSLFTHFEFSKGEIEDILKIQKTDNASSKPPFIPSVVSPIQSVSTPATPAYASKPSFLDTSSNSGDSDRDSEDENEEELTTAMHAHPIVAMLSQDDAPISPSSSRGKIDKAEEKAKEKEDYLTEDEDSDDWIISKKKSVIDDEEDEEENLDKEDEEEHEENEQESEKGEFSIAWYKRTYSDVSVDFESTSRISKLVYRVEEVHQIPENGQLSSREKNAIQDAVLTWLKECYDPNKGPIKISGSRTEYAKQMLFVLKSLNLPYKIAEPEFAAKLGEGRYAPEENKRAIQREFHNFEAQESVQTKLEKISPLIANEASNEDEHIDFLH